MKKYIPVRCPVDESHPDKAPLLAILSKDSFFVRCTDWNCRKKTPNRGWFEITLTDGDTPIVRPVPDNYHFDIEKNHPVAHFVSQQKEKCSTKFGQNRQSRRLVHA